MPVSMDNQILKDIAELYGVAESSHEKIDKMYEIIVIGTPGTPPLPETVRKHAAWIKECDEEKKLEASRKFEMKKGIILLAAGQALTLVAGVAAVIAKK